MHKSHPNRPRGTERLLMDPPQGALNPAFPGGQGQFRAFRRIENHRIFQVPRPALASPGARGQRENEANRRKTPRDEGEISELEIVGARVRLTRLEATGRAPGDGVEIPVYRRGRRFGQKGEGSKFRPGFGRRLGSFFANFAKFARVRANGAFFACTSSARAPEAAPLRIIRRVEARQ